jgi:hypothetical protein
VFIGKCCNVEYHIVLLSVAALNVDTPGAIKLNVILLIVTFFIFIRRVIMVSVLLVSAIMLNIT